MRAIAFSLDLTGPDTIAARHGIRYPAQDPMLAYREALHRFADLCAYCGGVGTLFAPTQDVLGVAAQRLRELARQGLEVASHSHEHDDRLASRSPEQILGDLTTSRKVLKDEVGIDVAGFRAPGYRMNKTLLEKIREAGFSYDSSVVPSPWFQLSQAGRSAGGNPLTGLGPTVPYRVDRTPFRAGNSDFVELPLAVTPKVRLPVNSGALLQASAAGRRKLVDGLSQLETVVLSIQAIDLMDLAAGDVTDQLLQHEPALRGSGRERLEKLGAVMKELGAAREIRTCQQLAELAR